jgi:formylglycine-generating enzyme required for sulfatase activity
VLALFLLSSCEKAEEPIIPGGVIVIDENGILAKYKFMYVNGGQFQMGSNNGDSDERPVHTVVLSNYYIGETEVTAKLWHAVMGSNPSYYGTDLGSGEYPVENVSYDEVQTFITKLNALLPGYNFRLPTEAEWEFAARGGIYSEGYTFAGHEYLDYIASYSGTTNYISRVINGRQPNELGIYDMSGNVWEWCQDVYKSDYYYNGSGLTNPLNKDSYPGCSYVLRGGSWKSDANGCRVANRASSKSNEKSGDIGFRLVCTYNLVR